MDDANDINVYEKIEDYPTDWYEKLSKISTQKEIYKIWNNVLNKVLPRRIYIESLFFKKLKKLCENDKRLVVYTMVYYLNNLRIKMVCPDIINKVGLWSEHYDRMISDNLGDVHWAWRIWLKDYRRFENIEKMVPTELFEIFEMWNRICKSPYYKVRSPFMSIFRSYECGYNYIVCIQTTENIIMGRKLNNKETWYFLRFISY